MCSQRRQKSRALIWNQSRCANRSFFVCYSLIGKCQLHCIQWIISIWKCQIKILLLMLLPISNQPDSDQTAIFSPSSSLVCKRLHAFIIWAVWRHTWQNVWTAFFIVICFFAYDQSLSAVNAFYVNFNQKKPNEIEFSMQMIEWKRHKHVRIFMRNERGKIVANRL